MKNSHQIDFREVFADGRPERTGTRSVPAEVPVSFEINGIGYAVMMATPDDLEDFAYGFCFAEQLIDTVDEVQDIQVAPVDLGTIIRLSVSDKGGRVMERARRRVVESSCGLCGLENLEAVHRELVPIATQMQLVPEAIFKALGALRAHQHLGQQTSAVHGAAFCSADGDIVMVREDVGRHNALDKLVGGLLREGYSPGDGFALLTARCSYELVEKSVLARFGALVTISAPTEFAIVRARKGNLPLWVLARHDSVLNLTGGQGY